MTTFEFKGWETEGTLRAVFMSNDGVTKSATPLVVETDYWNHVALEQGRLLGDHTFQLTMEEASIARRTLDLFPG